MNYETKRIMVVGKIRESLAELGEVLSTTEIALYLPTEELSKKYEKLEKQYEDFYKLSIEERLVASGMSAKQTKD